MEKTQNKNMQAIIHLFSCTRLIYGREGLGQVLVKLIKVKLVGKVSQRMDRYVANKITYVWYRSVLNKFNKLIRITSSFTIQCSG